MQDSDRPAALHAALRFVITGDIPSEHKATLIEVLTQALRDDAAAELRRQALAHAHGEWQEHEIEQLKAFLHDRIARSWQHADECVMHLAAQLHRDPRSVRDKATDLGLGASVDYRLATALRRARE
jgi:hypothetical protein